MITAILPLITVPQGADFVYPITWSSKVGEVTTPVDLTGCTARMQARARINDANALFTLTTENGGIVLGGETGRIELVFPADMTSAHTWSRGLFDLEIVLQSGKIRRLCKGPIALDREVTRD
jgi:hypothetical protein